MIIFFKHLVESLNCRMPFLLCSMQILLLLNSCGTLLCELNALFTVELS